MQGRVYIGLVHYPIYDKNEKVIATAITNLDIHDIARSSRTYGIQKYFIIHPLESQRKLAQDILEYWQQGYGGQYNPDRQSAFSLIRLAETIEEAIGEIERAEGKKPWVVTTDARKYANTVSYQDMRGIIEGEERPVLLLFGTGWGIEQSMMASFDYILEPIYGPCDYNHLSVRGAVAIILDRLLGEAWWNRES